MKRIEELGISPWPWSFADDGIGEYDIRCSGVSYGEDYEGDDIIAQSIQKKDAPMLAAAPELYEALREAVSDKCVGCCRRIDDENGNCATLCMVGNWRKALAKASGEEESE